MINIKADVLRDVVLPTRFITFFIALCTCFLIVSSSWKVSLGILLLVTLLMKFRRIEEFFLFWLLTFSFFTLDTLVFVKFGTHPILNYDRVLILIFLIFFFIEIILNKRKVIPICRIDIVFIIFLFVVAFSIVTKTNDKLMGLRYFTDSFLLPFLVYFLAKNFISNKELFNKFVNVLFIVGIYISVLGIYEFFSGRDLFHHPVYGGLRFINEFWVRVNGPFLGDYTFGFCVAICFFIAFYKYIISKKNMLKNILYFFVFGMMIVAVCLTFYRGILLSWALGLLTYFVITKRQLIKISFGMLLIVFLILPFVHEIKDSEIYKARISNVATIQDRFDRYSYALSLFSDSPINGVGFRNYRMLALDTGQHNQIITMLSETGILGTFVYIYLFYLFAQHGIKRYKTSKDTVEKQFSLVYLSILVVYLFLGVSDNSGFDKYCNLLFFAISGVALNQTRGLNNKNKNE